jgi:hypothetical protein
LAIHSKLIHGGGPNRSKRDRDLLAVQFAARRAKLMHSAEEFETLTLCNRDEMVGTYQAKDAHSVSGYERVSIPNSSKDQGLLLRPPPDI